MPLLQFLLSPSQSFQVNKLFMASISFPSLYYVEPKTRNVFRLLGDIDSAQPRSLLSNKANKQNSDLVLWRSSTIDGPVFVCQQLLVRDKRQQSDIYRQSSTFILPKIEQGCRAVIPMQKYGRSKALFFRPPPKEPVKIDTVEEAARQRKPWRPKLLTAASKTSSFATSIGTFQRSKTTIDIDQCQPLVVTKIKTPPPRKRCRPRRNNKMFSSLDEDIDGNENGKMAGVDDLEISVSDGEDELVGGVDFLRRFSVSPSGVENNFDDKLEEEMAIDENGDEDAIEQSEIIVSEALDALDKVRDRGGGQGKLTMEAISRMKMGLRRAFTNLNTDQVRQQLMMPVGRSRSEILGEKMKQRASQGRQMVAALTGQEIDRDEFLVDDNESELDELSNGMF